VYIAAKMPKATNIEAAISERRRDHKARHETAVLACSVEWLIFFFYSLGEYFVSVWKQLFVIVVVVVVVAVTVVTVTIRLSIWVVSRRATPHENMSNCLQ
jgi:membrane protein YdbS with pleckstrin-like domain